MIRIAIADDHPIVREGLRRIVADDSGSVVVGEASSGAELKAVLRQAPHERLSDREFEVLCALGSGIAVKDAAAKLGLSPKSVSTYRTRIFEKMTFSTGADLVRYAAQPGLIQ